MARAQTACYGRTIAVATGIISVMVSCYFFGEEIMPKFVSFIAIAVFALFASSVEAAKKKPPVTAARSASVQTSAPVQNIHPKLENAVWVTPHQE
jgi:hypothetical protein